MPIPTLDPSLEELPDGTIHLTAIWYLFEEGCLFIATSSKSRKAAISRRGGRLP
jgi:hypothetical protein